MPSSLGDYGTFLVGVGAVGTFIQTFRNHRVAKRLESSVGEANGQTLTELTHHVIQLVEYTHTRNHDLLNGQQQTNLALYVISDQLKTLVELLS